MKLWIARDKNGDLSLFDEMPIRTFKRWSVDCADSLMESHPIELDKHLFPEVKWEDDEPTEVELKIVKK